MIGPTDLLHPSPAPHFKTFHLFLIYCPKRPSAGIITATWNNVLNVNRSLVCDTWLCVLQYIRADVSYASVVSLPRAVAKSSKLPPWGPRNLQSNLKFLVWKLVLENIELCYLIIQRCLSVIYENDQQDATV